MARLSCELMEVPSGKFLALGLANRSHSLGGEAHPLSSRDLTLVHGGDEASAAPEGSQNITARRTPVSLSSESPLQNRSQRPPAEKVRACGREEICH